MSNEPVLFNPEMPLAHYEKCKRMYAAVKKSLTFGTVMPIAAFACTIPCVALNPHLMAALALFSVPFSLLSIIGCVTRRAKLCLFAAPLAFILAFVAIISKTLFAPIGAVAYILAAISQINAIPHIHNFYMLKELPGFPFFDPAMDDISFAAMDIHGADEFIDESSIHEELEVKKLVPTEPPSDEMSEIITEGLIIHNEDEPQLSEFEQEAAEAVKDIPEDLRDDVIASLGHLAPNLAEYEENAEEKRQEHADRPYERMINAQVKNKSNLSDVELFG